MQIYDISISLAAETPVWPGDPAVETTPVSRLSRGGAANVSRLVLSSHAGTHVDPPHHSLEHGISVDHLPLTLLVGEAVVIDLVGIREIDRKDLARHSIKGHERVLLKTSNSALWDKPGFQDDYVALTEAGAAYLAECGVRLVGIDYLSIEPVGGNGDIHRLLLGEGVVILEGLNLDGVPAGEYELICLPLKIKGGDGAPARAILRTGGRPSDGHELELHTSRWPLS